MLKYKLGWYYEIMRVSDSLIWRNDDIERWLTYSPAHSLTMFRVSFAIKNENNFKNYFRNVISNNNNHTQINEWQERIFIDWDIKKWWEVLFLLVLYWKAPLSNTISDEPDVVPGGVADHLLPAALPPALHAPHDGHQAGGQTEHVDQQDHQLLLWGTNNKTHQVTRRNS